ncbi:MAG: hypothetical protein ACJAZP_002588 [Psychromonas sp.]|jgi:hypothetical protein
MIVTEVKGLWQIILMLSLTFPASPCIAELKLCDVSFIISTEQYHVAHTNLDALVNRQNLVG